MLSTAPNCHQNQHHLGNFHMAKFSYHHDVQPWAPLEHSFCMLTLKRHFQRFCRRNAGLFFIGVNFSDPDNQRQLSRQRKVSLMWSWSLVKHSQFFQLQILNSKYHRNNPQSIFEGLLDFPWKRQSQNPIAFSILVLHAPRKQPTEL